MFTALMFTALMFTASTLSPLPLARYGRGRIALCLHRTL